MKHNYDNLRSLLDSAKMLLSQIIIDYTSQIGPKTKQLIDISKHIVPAIKDKHPEISEMLERATHEIANRQPVVQFPYGYIDFINAYSFGDIRTIIKILDVLYPTRMETERKIFISHSSEDQIIVNAFVEKILMLGCGFKTSDIFCTLDHTAIRTGDDFRNEIIQNMRSCDFILCMISENYRKSEVCQNEMGAAWALEDKRVLPFKFPNIKFSEIGFLSVVKQAADITDKSKLDELYEELCNYYGLQFDWRNYNKQKDSFVELVAKEVCIER